MPRDVVVRGAPQRLDTLVKTMLKSDDVLVTVGSGAKAHVFRPMSGATFKSGTLHDGGSVYDRALCGSGGELFATDDDDLCKTCSSLLDAT